MSISTTYYPIAWPSPELATLTIHLGAKPPDLPIRPPNPKDATLPAFGPADPRAANPAHLSPGRKPTPAPRHPRPAVRQNDRRFPALDLCQNHARHRPDPNRHRHHPAIEITDGDPLSAITLTDYKVTMQFPGHTIHHHSTGRMSCTATHFRIEQTLEIHEADTLIFERQWDEEIPRDMV